MATPKGGTTLDTGFVGRAAAGLRYLFTGKTPEFFGPGEPIAPAAQEQALGRQLDYPTGYNIQIRPRAGELTTFDTLRALADNYDLVRIAIETRKDQMEKLPWTIARRDTGADAEDDPTAKTLAELLRRPDREHSFRIWMRMLLEEVLVTDATSVYVRRTLGGGPYAIEQIDGATIKRVIDPRGRTPAPPAPGETFDPKVHAAYQQILKGLPAVDYHAGEMLYAPRNPRVHKLYGYSPVEQILMIINIGLRRQVYQLEYFTEGNVPEALIGVPEKWNPDQIKQLQTYFDELLTGDTAARRRIRFVPGGMTPVPTKTESLFDGFDEWLARVVCYAFSLPNQAFVKQVNRATAETAQEAALEEGLAPLMEWFKDVMDRLVQDYLGYSEYEFIWQKEESLDPLVQAQVDEIYVKNKIRRVNEVRDDRGWPKDPELDELQTAPPPDPFGAGEGKPGAPGKNGTTPAAAAGDSEDDAAAKLRKRRSLRRGSY